MACDSVGVNPSEVAAARQTLRCEHCGLNQYMTSNRNCRRCHLSLDPEPELPFVAPTPPLYVKRGANEDPVVDVGRALRVFRIRQGFTQRTLAPRLGAGNSPRTYICKIENGVHTPNPTQFARLAKALNVNLVDFALLSAPRSGELFDEPFVVDLLPYTHQLSTGQFAEVLHVVILIAKASGVEIGSA